MNRKLVITADDFGAAKEVNDAVELAHRRGVLTAASLMVTGPAAADAVARAKMMPSLRVGLHLVLVDGEPALQAAEVPLLIGRDGRFDKSMVRAGAKMFFLPSARRQLAAEIEAQFQAFAATDLPLDHVNTHKHFHLHPTIAKLVVAIGRPHGMKALRVPFETDHLLARTLRRRYRADGLLVSDRVYGLRWSGEMTRERLAGIVSKLPQGLSEIYLHPATGPYPGSAEGYRYAEELLALQDVEIPLDIRCGGFADFAGAQ